MANDLITLLETQIKTALKKLNLPDVNINIEYPKNETHGDLASSVALTLYAKLREENNSTYASPMALAQTIADQLKQTNDQRFTSIDVLPPGFINFNISQTALLDQFNHEYAKETPVTATNQGKKVIVEYSSPNIAKPFTVGHLRSTIIGQAIANIKSATGWTVLRDNHLGDWGTQFGKLIYAIKQNWIPIQSIETADNPVELLVELYVKFHQEAETNPDLEAEARAWFKKLEDNDQQARSIWQQCVDWSWKEFDRIYRLLNVSFSHKLNQGRGLGESFFENKMQPVIDQLEQQKLLTIGEEGAKIVEFESMPPLMILKKDGATLYATRDLATDYYRLQTFQPDIIINEVGNEQSLYFKQIFEIETKLGWFKPHQRVHVGHGLYRFKDGKMSTRKGNVIWLSDVIEKAIKKAHHLINEGDNHSRLSDHDQLAKEIAIGALIWNDLKGEPKRDIVFDWDEILSMKGNSGPYIQYTHARTHSIHTKAAAAPEPIDLDAPINLEERALITWLIRFDSTIMKADQTLNPSVIATYLYELCQRFNTFYNQHTILGQKDGRQAPKHRLTLTNHTRKIIHTGLSLLGIPAPNKM